MILADYFRSEHDTAWDIAISSGVRHGVIKIPNIRATKRNTRISSLIPKPHPW